MNKRNDARPVFVYRIADSTGLKDRAPLGIQGYHVATDPLGNFRKKISEPSKPGYQHLIATGQQRPQTGLNARPCRAIYQKSPLVLCLINLPVERHSLIHVFSELGIKLTQHRDRHGTQDARVDVHRSRAHDQAWAWIQFLKRFRHRCIHSYSLLPAAMRTGLTDHI